MSGLHLTSNARAVLERRYLLKDESGNVIETPDEMFRRVARAIADVDRSRVGPIEGKRYEESYTEILANLDFLPNSPTLMNAGTEVGQLSACFVIPVRDSIHDIFQAVAEMAKIHQSGGGTGFSFTSLRPKGDEVRLSGGVASGPVSFMRIFDTATEVVKQGGRRRGANMGILRADHPDILEFVEAKSEKGLLTNFNLSVEANDHFMEAVRSGGAIDLINPRTGRATGKLDARDLFDRIARSAWAGGDPGLIFLDEMNRHNPTPASGPIEATNPCGEQPLLPHESCNLGSINLRNMIRDGGVDWDRLARTIRIAVRFLDNIIDANRYPVDVIGATTRANRKIGLGVMGWADVLFLLGIPYASEGALEFAGELMHFIQEEGHQASIELGKERGSFPNFGKSVWAKIGYPAMRNATVTTIAPTGTLSIIAGTTSGIEPVFALAFVRRVLDGTRLREVNPIFVEWLRREMGAKADSILESVAKTGSLSGTADIPDESRSLFVTAADISGAWHVRMQAAFQAHTDNAVSKTVNLPRNAGWEDVRDIFHLAYDLKCKGITVYRDGSREGQVLAAGQMPELKKEPQGVTADPEYSGECKPCAV